MKIILVCIGNFQEYIINNIKNLQLFNNNDIVVLTNKQFFNNFNSLNVQLYDVDELDDNEYLSKTKMDRHFRNGFWIYCSLRLFYLFSYIKKYNITNCIHLENDVMSYINFDDLKYHFKFNKVYAAYDSYTRVIPGIIFIPDYKSFEPIITNYDFALDDMFNIGKHDETIIEPLPIFPILDNINKFNKNYINCIFDAAAMGQYLGGIDERNMQGDTRGYVSKDCLIKYDIYSFFWIKINNLYVPHIKINNNLIRIINLHIHSKKLDKFMANDPLEDKYILKNIKRDYKKMIFL